ncbi:actin cytoskeleton and mitosis protein, partial [Basidiobolus ranarum]
IDPARAVKAYHRPAAGNEQPLPSDVRPPSVLTRTLDYLIDEIVGNDPGLEDSHGFIRDRTRSIRQDFTLQNCRSLEAVLAHERIARYHILCLHQLCDNSSFSEQQETEQLRKVLRSLQEFYDDLREEGIPCPNEAEFRAYNIITHLRDIDMARQAQLYPKEIFCSSIVQQALKFHSLCQINNAYYKRNMSPNCEAAPNFFSKFFKLVRDRHTSYLMACLLEWHFVDVRKYALKAMNKTFLYQLQGYPMSDLVELLWFDDEDQAIQECQTYGLEVIEDPILMVKFGKKDVESKRLTFYDSDQTFKQIKSVRLVESKRNGLSNGDIVNGILSGEGTDSDAFAMTFDLTIPETKYSIPDSRPRNHSTMLNAEVEMKTRAIPSPRKPSPFTQPPASTIPSLKSIPSLPKANFSFSLSALDNKGLPSNDPTTTTVDPLYSAPTKIPSLNDQKTALPSSSLPPVGSIPIPPPTIPATIGTLKHDNSITFSKSEGAPSKRIDSTESVKHRLAELEKVKKAKEERQRLIDTISREILESLVSEATGNYVANIARVLVTQCIENERRKAAMIAAIAEQAFQFIFASAVQESIESTVASSISNFKSLRKGFTHWKDTYIEIKTQREIERQLALKSSLNFRSLGICNPQTSLDDQVRLLVGVSKNGLTEGRGLTITEDANGSNIATALEEAEHSKYLWEPIPVHDLLKHSLNSKTWDLPWSLGICYDSMNELTAKWLRIKLGPSHVWPKAANGVDCFEFHEENPQYNISLLPNNSIRNASPKSMRFSATIFQVSFFPEDYLNKEKIAQYWSQQRETLREFLHLSSDLSLPLLVVFWPSSDESITYFKQTVENGLGLDSFSGHKFVSTYHILTMTTETMDHGLRDNLRWLASCTTKKQTNQSDKLNVLLNGFQELYDWILYNVGEKVKISSSGTSATQTLSITNLIISSFNEIIFELGQTIRMENPNLNPSSLRILEMCIIPAIALPPTINNEPDAIINSLTSAYDDFIHSLSFICQSEKDFLYGRVYQMITRNSLERFSYDEVFSRIGQSILENLKEYSLNAPLPKNIEGLLKRCRNHVHSQIFKWEIESENPENNGFNKRKADLASIINVSSPKKTKAYSQELPKTTGLTKLITDVKEWLNSL